MFKRFMFYLFSKLFDHKGEYTMSEAVKDQQSNDVNATNDVEVQPTPAETSAPELASNDVVAAPEAAGDARPEVQDTVESTPVVIEPVAVAEPSAPVVAPAPVVVPAAEPAPVPVAPTTPTDSDKTEGEPDTNRFDHLASTLKSLLQVAGHELDEAFDDAVPLAKQIASSDEEFGDKLKDILVVVGREYGEAFHHFFSYAKKHI